MKLIVRKSEESMNSDSETLRGTKNLIIERQEITTILMIDERMKIHG